MSLEKSRQHSVITPELYFLISKFLTAGPLKETAQVLRRELEKHNVLPKRLDWEGNEHNQTFEELEQKFPHISTQHLLEICGRIGPILEREIPPSVPGVMSLLGAGRQSLLRTLDTKLPSAQLLEHIVRWKEMPMIDTFDRKEPHNLVHVLQGRQYSGPTTRKLLVPSSLYAKQQLLRRTLGHLSAVYCVLFDRTGQYIITGADDLLVKVWSVIDGRLLNTFRGASAEITDIDINFENTLLAAGSLDRLLRVWELQSGAPVAVLSGHTGMITSINFCPSTRWDLRYLITTSTDGSVAFWTYTYNSKWVNKASFVSKPIQYHERMRPGQAQMICASFSPGGMFLAAGSADHHVRVYLMHGDEGPHRILELEAHTDTVDSIQWAHNGLRFISGSKDGTAHVWHFESQQWKSHQLLMSARLPGTPPLDEETKKLKVTMVSWDCSDCWVITAVNDHTLKVWDAATGKLSRVLTGHTDEVYVLESHPKDPHILLSAGHDGQIFIWDIVKGESLARFLNNIEGQGHGAVFDAKWSPDGTMLAATDSHGHILMFGFGMGNERLKNLPKELFFHTDYRPLVRDNQHWVLDEQTQVPPHLMPPPFLVDVDGNPYPPVLQRLVPGREHCPSEQLIPNIALGDGGFQEVIEGIPAQEPRSDLDIMIAALAHRQYGEEPGNGDPDGMNGGPFNRHQNSPRSVHRVGLRRNGDVEGVRQSSGNWQHEGNIKWVKKTLVKPLSNSALHVAKAIIGATGLKELETYRKEMKRRPIMISTAAVAGVGGKNGRTRRFGARKNAPAYRTRAVRSEQRQQEEEELPDPDTITPSPSNSGDSGDSTAREEDLQESSSSSDSESSGYSDWVADHGVTLEPPKRSKRKPVKKRPLTPPTDSEKRRPARKKKVAQIPHQLIEVPEAFRPPEWLSEIIPRKAPYYPQMGDEVMYFRQGHQLYIDAVRSKRIYELTPRSEPWTRTHLREQEFVKVVGIKYEIRPPRLCCLKLALLDPDGKLTGDAFTIKYHDMADVLDFFVLKQTYDTAMLRNWQPGDRFRCMIDDGWWLGTIESQSPINSSFPDSPFMCYRIRWDNGEYEHMSPWDLEPISHLRMPTIVGGAVSVLPEEIQAILYQPKSEEWPGGDREATCRRIIAGLDQVMGLAIAEPFAAPVDLNHYPSYAFVVEYPIDLSTIKARFENHFYRRITSAQFDVRYLATNAEKFNEPHSQIVKQARIITDLCLKIIKERNSLDVGAVYHQLVDTYQSSDSDVDVETIPGPSTSTGRVRSIRRSKRLDKSSDWRKEALSLLEVLWQCEDSTPFREPVDRLEHPDYYQMIDTPMDLGTIKEDLLGGNYETPMDFAKDMQLIFQNSRNFNTNKRSRIYSMTIRLSAMFEEHMHNIIYNWKSARRRESIIRRKKSTPVKMTTRYNGAPPPKLKPPMTSDEEDDLPLSHKKISPRFKENGFLNGDAAGSSQPSTSRVSNGPVSRPVIKLKITNKPGHSRRVSDEHESENSESEASSTTDSDSSVPISKLGLPRRRRRKHKSDSEESYKPNARKGKALVNRNTHFKGKTKRGKGLKRRYGRPDSDSDFKLNKPSRRTPVKSRRKYKETDEDESAEESEEQWDVSNNGGDKTSDNSVNKSLLNNKNSSDSEHCLRSSMRRNLSSVDESSQSSLTRTSRAIKKQSYEELDSDVDDRNADDDEEEDDSDAEEESAGRPVRAVRKNYRLMVQNENADEDEDDRPLGEVRRNFHLAIPQANDVDDDFDEEDSRPIRSARKNYRMTDSDSDAIGTITRPRRVKRRHYGEESDDSADNGVVQTVKRRHYDSDDSARNEPSISISSRGRVRKLTARARALLRD